MMTTPYKPWLVPHYAIVLTAIWRRSDEPRVPLAKVSDAHLDALCDRFRADVWKLAGRRDPREAR